MRFRNSIDLPEGGKKEMASMALILSVCHCKDLWQDSIPYISVVKFLLTLNGLKGDIGEQKPTQSFHLLSLTRIIVY